MKEDTRDQKGVLSYTLKDTVYRGIETDKVFLRDLNRLAKAAEQITNPLTMTTELPEPQCEDIAIMAELHRDANIPNSSDINNKKLVIDKLERCRCGCKAYLGDPIPVCIQNENLKNLGSSLVLSLNFMKVTCFLALTLFVTIGLYSIGSNIFQGEANLGACNGQIYCQYKRISSLEGKKSNLYLTRIQMWLGLPMTIIFIMILRYVKFDSNNLHKMIDRRTKTPSDLAVKFENLPYAEYDEEQLTECIRIKQLQLDLNVNEQREQIKINALHIVYNMSRVRELIQQIRQESMDLAKMVDEATGQIEEDIEQYKETKIRLIELIETLQDYRKRFLYEGAFRRGLSTTCSIIEFFDEKSKDKFLNRYGTESMGILDQIKRSVKFWWTGKSNSIRFKGKAIVIERAPEPEDIMWENCQKQYSLSRLILIWILTLFIILLSLGAVVGLDILQVEYARKAAAGQVSDTIPTILGYLIPISLVIVNKVLWVILTHLIKIEYSHTKSEEYISRINKTVIAQSLNCIIVPLISNLVLKSNLYGAQGIVGQSFDYSISNSVIPLVFLYVDIGYILKVIALNIRCIRVKIIRYMAQSQHLKAEEIKYIHKVNSLYEGGDIDITNSYVYLIANLYHAAFYCSLQPTILLILTVATAVFYFLKKILLLRRYMRPQKLNKLVFNNALSCLSYIPIIYGVGALVFSLEVFEPDVELIVPNCLIFVLALLNIANPGGLLDKLIECTYVNFNKKSVTKVKAEATDGKKTQTTEEDEEFVKGYSNLNHISSLIGFEKALTNRPIDQEVENEVKIFLHGFGVGEQNKFNFPADAESQLELVPPPNYNSNKINYTSNNSAL